MTSSDSDTGVQSNDLSTYTEFSFDQIGRIACGDIEEILDFVLRDINLQSTFSNGFFLMKLHKFRLRFQ